MLRFLRGGGKSTKTIWWAIAIITIITFVGGFVFLFGAGLDATQNARATGAVAVVNGERVSSAEYQSALLQQREAYRRQFGVDPAERDQKMLETQAWRSLVTERLVNARAQQLGLRATDEDVKIAMKTNPPPLVLAMQEFQTNGQFDANKYRAALQNPSFPWGPYEELAREQVPMRKLEERLLSSIKVTDAELRQAFHDQYDRIDASVVAVQPAPDAKVAAPTEAELQATYDRYKGRFASGPRVQLEVLRVPKQYGEEEIRDANQLAKSLVDRVRRGEKFEDLARDFSEGPNADQGGLVPRPVSLQELGPEMGPRMLALAAGDVLDPVQDAGRFVIVKLVEKLPPGANGMPQLRIAQIIVKVKANDASQRKQLDDLKKIRQSAAAAHSLAQAVSAKGMTTVKTAFFDYGSPPNELYTVPEAAEWGLGAKTGDLSPIFEGIDEYVIAQVAARHAGGPAPRSEIADPIRQLTELGKKVDGIKSKADAIAKSIAGGQRLEDAARAQGLAVSRITGMSRSTPDPRLGSAPEAVGAMMAARPGQVVGPVRSANGWYFVRLDGVTVAPDTTYERNRSSLAREFLQRRQQSFFVGFTTELREKAKVQDLRSISAE